MYYKLVLELPKLRGMKPSPGVGAKWLRSSGSSLNLVKRALLVSEAMGDLALLKKLLIFVFNKDSVWSLEKIVDFSSISLSNERGTQKNNKFS